MNQRKKLLAMLLCAAMCISMLPTWSFAEGETGAETDSGITEAAGLPDGMNPEEAGELQHEHAYVPTVIAPSCTEQGYTVFTCGCGDSYVSDYTDALNHPEIHEIAEIPATCTTDGMTAGKRCAVCGETVEGFETIPATGHIPVEVGEVPATTESTGTTAGTKCAVCGEILNGCEVIPAVQPETTAEPEPISDLSQGDQNANQAAGEVVMQSELTEETSYHEHNYTASVTAPTCTEQGYTTYTCECGDSYVADYIDALSHPEIIDIPEVPASETENGTTAGKKCAICGQILEGCQDLPRLEQTVITITQQPENTVAVDRKAEFTVTASVNKELELEYQWQRLNNTAEYADETEREAAWENLEDEIASTLTIIGLEEEETLAEYQKYAFRCTLTAEDVSTVTKEAAILAPLTSTGIATAAKKSSEEIIASGNYGDNVTWELDQDGVLTISGTGDLSYGGWDIDSVRTAIIEEGVTSIGYEAFNNCSSLTSVTIPSSVTSIGDYAFSGCSSLANLTIPEGVTSIHYGAFIGCDSLMSLTIPRSVTSIGRSAFYGCSSLMSVTIPESVTSIGGSAFSGCSSLTSVTIPGSVTSIGDSVFSGCSSLTNVTIPESVTSIGVGVFSGCSSLTSVTIPGSVTSIGRSAFRGCSSLTSLTIPESVGRIGSHVFADCDGLKSAGPVGSGSNIEFGWTKSIPSEAFSGCSSLTSVAIPEGVTSIDRSAFYGCSSLMSVTIPESVTSIGYDGLTSIHAFTGCDGLKSAGPVGSGSNIEFGWTKRIPYEAFRGCTSLTSVTIPESLTDIGSRAFSGCDGLKSAGPVGSGSNIEFGWTKSIPSEAFLGCSSLTSVTIPESLTDIGSRAFSGCDGLKSAGPVGSGSNIEFGWTKSIPAIAFYGCSSLTSVTIPGSVTSIGGSAFSGCSSLTSVTIPEGVTSIGGSAFSGCSSLTSVTIPGSVTSIGAYAFSACSSLTSVTIPEGVTSISDGAFSECSSLANVTIPEGVTSINYYAFSECSSLTSVKIPGSVLSIDYEAFKDSMLENVYYTGSRTEGSNLFDHGIMDGNERLRHAKWHYNVAPDGYDSCGETVWWKYDGSTRSLEIRGRGAMWDFYSDNQPWSPWLSKLVKVTLQPGVTGIGDYAFYNCRRLRSITIPDSITGIWNEAFGSCSSLTEIFFQGNAPGIAPYAFSNVTADAFYQPDKDWWQDDLEDYGGSLTWHCYCEAPVLTEAFNSATGVRVSWNPVPGAVKYRLLRKNLTKDETSWKNVGETTECSLIDKTVTSASRYTFTVECIDQTGTVTSGRDETGRTCTYIAKADITTLKAISGGVSVTWSKPAGAKNFRVMRRPDGTNSWAVIAVVEGTSYTDTTAPKGVKLWYTVRGVSMDNKVLINSYNGTGWSLYHVNPPVMTEAFNSATGVRVSWNPVTGAAKYRLLRKNVTAGETAWTTIGETKDLTLIDKSAVSAQRYTYTVECIDSNGRTSSAQNATGRTCTYIAMAKIMEIKGVTNGVSLTWSKPAGAKNFRVFRKVDGSSTWTAVKDIQGTTWTDTSAQKNVKYWYTVRAITLAGDMYINSYNGTGWSVTRK